MNNVFYGIFSLNARFLGYCSAVAAMALYSGILTFFYIFCFSIGTNLPHLRELVLTIAFSSFVSTMGHGLQFGFPVIKIPAIDSQLRFANSCILRGSEPKLRADLTLEELKRLLEILLHLPKKNGKIGAFWAMCFVIPVYALTYWYHFETRQLMLIGILYVLAVALHGSVTFIFSELAISRIVSECRRAILSKIPAHREPVSSSMNLKFLILGQAFITALVNLFGITYFAKGSIETILVILFYSIFMMVLLGYLVLYRIGASLREIRQAATNLRDGSDQLIYSKAMDAEFVDIADGLNSATLSIQDHQKHLEGRIVERTKELSIERDKSEKLLLNILPVAIANELKQHGSAKSVHFDSVTVLFTDFVGFTRIAEKLAPTELVGELDRCFSYFDNVAQKYGLEKLKTIGDAYMAAGGIPEQNRTHPFDCALAALEIQAFMNQMKQIKEQQGFPYWELRLGMHTGPLVAGVVGEKKFAYDVWGDTVNTASRMESSGAPGAINISRELFDQIHFLFKCEYRGKVYAKNKGEIAMFFLHTIKRRYSVDGAGRVPNSEFHRIYDRVKAGARIAKPSNKPKP